MNDWSYTSTPAPLPPDTNIFGVQINNNNNNNNNNNTLVGKQRSRHSASLLAGRSEVRKLVGAISRNRLERSRAHPASFTMDTGSIPVVTRPERGVNHPPPSSTEVKERVELCLYSLASLHGRLHSELYLLPLPTSPRLCPAAALPSS
jgi:hypothetical protein